MLILPRQKVWTRQPPSRIGSHPYWVGRGLVALTLPGYGDVFSNTHAVLPSATSVLAGRSGRLQHQAVDGTIGFSIRRPRVDTFAKTLLFVQEVKARVLYGGWLGAEAGKDGVSGQYADTELGFNIHGSGWNTQTKVFDGQAPVSLIGQPRTIVVKWSAFENSGYGRAWVDGVEVARTGGSPQTSVSLGTAETSGGDYGTDQNGSGISVFAEFREALSDDEIVSLSRNPWQLFEPRRILVPVSVGGATIPTLSLPGVTEIGTTSARPRVTVTW